MTKMLAFATREEAEAALQQINDRLGYPQVLPYDHPDVVQKPVPGHLRTADVVTTSYARVQPERRAAGRWGIRVRDADMSRLDGLSLPLPEIDDTPWGPPSELDVEGGPER